MGKETGHVETRFVTDTTTHGGNPTAMAAARFRNLRELPHVNAHYQLQQKQHEEALQKQAALISQQRAGGAGAGRRPPPPPQPLGQVPQYRMMEPAPPAQVAPPPAPARTYGSPYAEPRAPPPPPPAAPPAPAAPAFPPVYRRAAQDLMLFERATGRATVRADAGCWIVTAGSPSRDGTLDVFHVDGLTGETMTLVLPVTEPGLMKTLFDRHTLLLSDTLDEPDEEEAEGSAR